MTKSDLKTGMLVQTRDGDIGLVIKKLDVIIFKSDYMNISDLWRRSYYYYDAIY